MPLTRREGGTAAAARFEVHAIHDTLPELLDPSSACRRNPRRGRRSRTTRRALSQPTTRTGRWRVPGGYAADLVRGSDPSMQAANVPSVPRKSPPVMAAHRSHAGGVPDRAEIFFHCRSSSLNLRRRDLGAVGTNRKLTPVFSRRSSSATSVISRMKERASSRTGAPDGLRSPGFEKSPRDGGTGRRRTSLRESRPLRAGEEQVLDRGRLEGAIVPTRAAPDPRRHAAAASRPDAPRRRGPRSRQHGRRASDPIRAPPRDRYTPIGEAERRRVARPRDSGAWRVVRSRFATPAIETCSSPAPAVGLLE